MSHQGRRCRRVLVQHQCQRYRNSNCHCYWHWRGHSRRDNDWRRLHRFGDIEWFDRNFDFDIWSWQYPASSRIQVCPWNGWSPAYWFNDWAFCLSEWRISNGIVCGSIGFSSLGCGIDQVFASTFVNYLAPNVQYIYTANQYAHVVGVIVLYWKSPTALRIQDETQIICHSQLASDMQRDFSMYRRKEKRIKSTNPIAHPVPNPRRNAKYGCFKRQSEEIRREKIVRSRCNTSRVKVRMVEVSGLPPGGSWKMAERVWRCGWFTRKGDGRF